MHNVVSVLLPAIFNKTTCGYKNKKFPLENIISRALYVGQRVNTTVYGEINFIGINIFLNNNKNIFRFSKRVTLLIIVSVCLFLNTHLSTCIFTIIVMPTI